MRKSCLPYERASVANQYGLAVVRRDEGRQAELLDILAPEDDLEPPSPRVGNLRRCLKSAFTGAADLQCLEEFWGFHTILGEKFDGGRCSV